MPKANTDTLNALHDRMAQYFESLLDSGERLAPGELSVIIKFLKDNEITAELTESMPMQNLVNKFMSMEHELIN
jgi:hypothetical protein